MTQTEPIRDAVRSAAATYPHAAHVTEQLLDKSRNLLGGHIAFMVQKHGDDFWRMAERLVQLVDQLGGEPVRSLNEYTIAYLREQVRFMQTKEYSHDDFDTVFREVYDNPEVMGRFYLEGLMLTHAYWPIHFDIHAFFAGEFLPRVKEGATGAEFGFGHGLYLLDVLSHRPGTAARGFDISKYSIEYAGKVLAAGSIDAGRYELGFADVREKLPQPDGAFGWAIFAEILEHIPDPLFSLKELRRCMSPGSPLFMTTVVNSNAIDHLYLFTDVQQVTDMLGEAGFTVAASEIFRVADYGKNSQDPSIDVAYVCEA